jgi:hypothetical protein
MKSREAALCAIRVFNDPNVAFKSETYIVLMMIAWTYLLHAHYRTQGIEYRYCRQGKKRKHFDRTKHGAYKHWELERCINCEDCPLDPDTCNNLRFLIGLRHEIEHQMTQNLDNYLSGRFQACALNFNEYIKKLFDARLGLDSHLMFSIQFLALSEEQMMGPMPDADIPPRLKAYMTVFDDSLTHDQYNSDKFSYRLLFKKKLVNRPGQADRVVEFIDPNTELAQQIDKEYWVKKDVERPKFRPTDVVAQLKKAGFTKFRVTPEHSKLWRAENAKDPAKGYGVDVQGVWYWYESWVTFCIDTCKKDEAKFK